MAAILLLPLLLGGCKLPRDPEGTSKEVQSERLIVGWIAGEPRAGAPEIEIIERVATQLGARIEVKEASLHRLVDDLHVGRIHLIAGNLPESSPLSTEYGMSRPVGGVVLEGQQVPTVIAMRAGENGFLSVIDKAIGR